MVAAAESTAKQILSTRKQDKSTEISASLDQTTENGTTTRSANVLANVESALLSPTTTHHRVISQERTPKGQKIARPATSGEEINSEKSQDLSGEVVQTTTDENSNNVQRSSGRLLKQLWSSLSPKMTEIKTDAERRVSRYGRHQKQKENIDYVPVGIMRYVGNAPVKTKSKPVDSAGPVANASKLTESDSSMRTDAPSNDMLFLPTQPELPLSLPLIQVREDNLIGIDEIKILNDNFDANTSLANVSDDQQQFSHNLYERKRSSDVDSAKGSSIDLDNSYRKGNIYWGAQTMKTIHWPCIVYVDPETDQIIRKHAAKGNEIHVSFFADRGRRGWVRESCMVPFEGVEDYTARIKNMEFGKQVRKQLKREMPRSWKTACALAEEYCAYPIEERIAKFDAQVRLEEIRQKIIRNRRLANGGRTNGQALKVSESDVDAGIN